MASSTWRLCRWIWSVQPCHFTPLPYDHIPAPPQSSHSSSDSLPVIPLLSLVVSSFCLPLQSTLPLPWCLRVSLRCISTLLCPDCGWPTRGTVAFAVLQLFNSSTQVGSHSHRPSHYLHLPSPRSHERSPSPSHLTGQLFAPAPPSPTSASAPPMPHARIIPCSYTTECDPTTAPIHLVC